MAHRPLVGITVFFTIGIFTNYLINIPLFFVFPAALIFTLLCIFLFIFRPRRNNIHSATPFSTSTKFYWKWEVVQARSNVFALLILILLTGIVYHHLKFSSNTHNNISNFINTENVSVRLRGIVISPPINKTLSGPALTSTKHCKQISVFLLRAEAIESTSENAMSGTTSREWKNISGMVKINIYPTQHEKMARKSSSLSDKLKYGDRVELIGTISIPSTSRNSGQFDYKQYLRKQNPRVDAIASVVSICNTKILSKGHGGYFHTFAYDLKNKLNTVLEKNLNKRSVPLISSILLGNRETVPVDLMDGFLRTGTIHFLAISGLHVGILVVSLHYLLRLFRLNTRSLSLIIILTVFLYATITGMKPPIVRAGIMVAMYYGAFIINRRWNLPNSIAAAVFIILLINPSDLFNVGFQLSVLAVLGIVYTSNRIENFFWKSTLLVEKLQAKEERSEVWFRIKIYCRKTFCVSMGAWIAVMPLIAYYFHIVTPFNVLLNIIIFPLIWLILVGGFIVLIVGLVFPVLATPFAWIISYSEIALENLVLFFSTNLKTFFYTSTPLWTWIVIYYLIVILFILRDRFKIKLAHVIISTLVIVNIFVFSGLSGRSTDVFKLTCFDVKHGASFFIQFPNGKNMLFDTGTRSNYDVGKFIVAPFLWQHGIKKVDTIVISHEHDDHCNGIPSIVDRFKVDNTFVNKFFLQSGKRVELLRFITEEKIKTGLLANGLEIKGYEPAKIMVLNPPDKDTLREEGVLVENISTNDSSSVLLIDYLGYKILLCGDIGEKGIETLLSGKDNPDVDLSADIIQVPHHGGFIANTVDLVKCTKPEHAIISGLAKDISSSTIEDYQKHRVSLYKTYESGAVSFTINEEGIKVSKIF
jgi:competence protein ComEC